MFNFLQIIVSSPLYKLLFGESGILAFFDKAKHKKQLQIENNENTDVKYNKMKGNIKIKNNKNVVIMDNDLMDS